MIKKFKFFKKEKNKNIQYELIDRNEFYEKVEEIVRKGIIRWNDSEKKSIRNLLHLAYENKISIHFNYKRKSFEIPGEIFKDEDSWYYLIISIEPLTGSPLEREKFKYFKCDELTGLLNCLRYEVVKY